MHPNISRRYYLKYGIKITTRQLASILDQYTLLPETPFPDGRRMQVPQDQWELVEFVLRVLSPYLVHSMFSSGEYVECELREKKEGIPFIITQTVTPSTHPWMNETLEVGEVLRYSTMPHYGVVNTYQGVPLHYNGGTVQINYSHVKLLT